MCCLLASSQISQAEQDSSTKTLFPISEFTLTNGLRVLTLEDHNCPIVSVQVWYHVGSANEPAGRWVPDADAAQQRRARPRRQ